MIGTLPCLREILQGIMLEPGMILERYYNSKSCITEFDWFQRGRSGVQTHYYLALRPLDHLEIKLHVIFG